MNKISGTTCAALVVANMIGTGVFTSLGYQVASTDSGFIILTLWVLGGMLAFCGAVSYAELALALPRSGGEYHFLACIYHPAAGFVAGVASTVVGFAAPVALASMAFAHYFAAAAGWSSPLWLAIGITALVTGIHVWSIGVGSRFQIAFTLLKIGLILGFIVAGLLFVREPVEVAFLPVPGDGRMLLSGAFAISLMYVMYSYSGWNAVVYLLGEVREPQRVVMPSLVGGTLFVAVLYVLINFVFLRSAPMEAYKGQLEVGQIAGAAIFGEAGGRVMSGLICLGLVSLISAMTWAGPRVLQVMGEDMQALRFFARKSAAGIPVRAILLQSLIVVVMVISSGFEAVLLYAGFTLTLCSFLAVLGVLILRWRAPHMERPYRCWGYPVTPLFFLAITGFTLIHLLLEKPMESLLGMATLCAGLVLFFAGRKQGRNRNGTTPP